RFTLEWLDDPKRVRELKMFWDAINVRQAEIAMSRLAKIDSGMIPRQATEEAYREDAEINHNDLWIQTLDESRASGNQPDPAETAQFITLFFELFAESRL